MRSLSLVIPAYGPLDILDRILAHVGGLKEVAGRCGFTLIEAIVVDDGNEFPIKVEPEPSDVPLRILRNPQNRGKGYSVRRGALSANGGWVLMSDMDESAPLSEFAALAPFADYAIACGSRSCGKDARPLVRRMLSRIFNMLSGTGLKDTQCGFKLFNMELMRPVFESQRTNRFAFDVELIRKAPSVKEVPIEWHGGRRSTLRVWRDAPRMLWDLLKIRLS